MNRIDALSRWLRTERPSRAKLVERAGICPSAGQLLAHGVTHPLPDTVARFEAVALERRAELLAELQLIDVIVAR